MMNKLLFTSKPCNFCKIRCVKKSKNFSSTAYQKLYLKNTMRLDSLKHKSSPAIQKNMLISNQYNRDFRLNKNLWLNIHTCCSNFSQESVAKPEDIKEEFEFQAETRMLLDIVARSLYSDKEVFIRELVSNASDALEKLRFMRMQKGTEESSDDSPLKVLIETDKHSQTLTFTDTGIGMSKQEIIDNLGTIARSGSKEFLKNLEKGAESQISNIIGQFGVGFYSAFMVADKVEIFTRSHLENSPGYFWASDGTGKYTIEERENIPVGTKIVCYLKSGDREFSDEKTVQNVLKKYSSFVGFPIEVNGTQVNTIEPLWLKDTKKTTNDEHREFYQFVAKSFDEPRFKLHFHMDAPLNLRCLLYFPESKPGLFELSKDSTESGVSLYCRKVLIKSKVDTLLPKWLRFVKGVVDSEDVPLNLSREMLQDSALIRKLRTVIQNRIVRFLVDVSRKEPESYKTFLTDYGIFLKEGILSTHDQNEKEEIAKLVVYESSKLQPGETTTLAEYVSKMDSEQKDIYYLAAPSRELAEASPYFEAIKKRGFEVLFCYESYDEVVLMQLRQFNQKNIISVEKELRQRKEIDDFEGSVGLQRADVKELTDWWKGTLSGKCFGIKTTPHLETHPCVVSVEDMGAARHFVRTQFGQLPEETRYSMLQPQLEINPSHPIIMKLNKLRTENPKFAELLSKQLFNNAMVTAGLIEDPRTVLASINQLLELALEKH